LGLGTAMVTFVSNSLAKKQLKKAAAYFEELLKYKVILIWATSGLLILSSYFIANFYYNKPIFYTLLAGGLYIPVVGITNYMNSVFQASNKFKYSFFREIIFQLVRLTLIPIGILLFLKMNLGNDILIAIVFLLLVLCYFLIFLFLKLIIKKKAKFLKKQGGRLTINEKKRLKKFILPLSLTALSGMFFGYIDILMLGHFVGSYFIGLYSAIVGLISAASAILGFLPGAILPVLTGLKSGPFKKIFGKSKKFMILITCAGAIFTFFTARYILMIYGNDYLPAELLLKLFSILLILLPLSNLYEIYFISIKQTKVIARMLIISTIMNILLNWVFIVWGMQFGMFEAVLGACVATIISRAFYLAGLFFIKRRLN